MKTKNTGTKKLIAVMMLLAMMLMSMTGCNWFSSKGGGGGSSSAEPETSVSVAVVTGVRSNVNRISVNSKEVADRVYDATFSSGRVVLVRCDGKPEQYLLTDIPEPDVKGLSEAKRKAIAEQYRKDIMAFFESNGDAKYPEADTLEAIRISANALRETEGSEKKYLVIVDSGLSTTGYLDFTKGLLDASTDEIVASLASEKALVDLSGIDVVWIYCGETAAPQEQLSELQKDKLREIYSAIIEAGNASSCVFRDEAPSAEPYTGLPEVSTVTSGSRTIDVKPISPVKLDPETVRFIGDSDEFVDPKAARKAIKDVADILIMNPDNRVYIVGGTAGEDGSYEESRRLSDARAKAVAEVLQEYGIESYRLVPMGLGRETPWHIDDTDSNGRMIEKLAKKNRSVWIVDFNDEEYGDILKDMR